MGCFHRPKQKENSSGFPFQFIQEKKNNIYNIIFNKNGTWKADRKQGKFFKTDLFRDSNA